MSFPEALVVWGNLLQKGFEIDPAPSFDGKVNGKSCISTAIISKKKKVKSNDTFHPIKNREKNWVVGGGSDTGTPTTYPMWHGNS